MSEAIYYSNLKAKLEEPSEDVASRAARGKPVSWLFEQKGRAAPAHAFGRYFMISALGVSGFIGLLIFGSIFPGSTFVVRPAALGWFVVFGCLRIATFSHQ